MRQKEIPVSETAGPNREGLEDLSFYSEQEEKPPEGLSRGGTDVTSEFHSPL